MTTWVVGYDFSDCSRLALRRAAAMLSARGGGRLVVVHAHPKGTTGTVIGVSGSATDLDHAYMKDAARQLDEDLQTVEADAVTVEQRVVEGRPAEAILEVAEAECAALIVVGSHGRRGLEHMLLGRAAETVARRARRSVLIIKHR